MKRINLFTTAVLAIVLLTGCIDNNRTMLEDAVEEINAECPMDFEEGITMTGGELTDEDMVYFYEFDEDLHGIEEYVDILPSLKEEVYNNLTNENSDDSVELYRVLVEEGLGIRYIFFGSNSGASFELTFTPDDISDILDAACD